MSDQSDYSSSNHHARRRYRHSDSSYATVRPIEIKIGNRDAPGGHDCIQATGDWCAGQFQRLVHTAVMTRKSSNEPLVITIDGWATWLHSVMGTVIQDFGCHPGPTNIQVQKWNNIQVPHRVRPNKASPWTFVIDQMNVPEVYYYTTGGEPPPAEDIAGVNSFVFRMGGWFCGRGAYRLDDSVAVILLFAKPDPLSRRIVSNCLFEYLYSESARDLPDMNEAGLAWIFLKLHNLLSDWNNVTDLIEQELDNAELDSKGQQIPVKLRTRNMHKQVDRIYLLEQFATFQKRGLQKVAKIRNTASKHVKKDLLWEEIDDALDDLEQHTSYLDSLKERFNNLIELEFNLENATQSDNGRFINIIAALFLPVSYLASLWGISSVSWSALSYLYAAIPIFFVSALFTLITPTVTARYQAWMYNLRTIHSAGATGGKLSKEKGQIPPGRKGHYSLLGEDAPMNASVPKSAASAGGTAADRTKGGPGGEGRDGSGRGLRGAQSRDGRRSAPPPPPRSGVGYAQRRLSDTRRVEDYEEDDHDTEKGGFRRR